MAGDPGNGWGHSKRGAETSETQVSFRQFICRSGNDYNCNRMKPANVKVSDAELQLLQILWSESLLSATELADRVPAARDWSLTTVKTLLSRLVAKGAIETKRDGRRFLYSPAVPRETIASSQVRGLIDRLFGGRVSPLVAQLAREGDFDSKDLDELEALIKSLRQ